MKLGPNQYPVRNAHAGLNFLLAAGKIKRSRSVAAEMNAMKQSQRPPLPRNRKDIRSRSASRACARRTAGTTLACVLASALAMAEEPVSPDADFTVREISSALHKADRAKPLDFSNHDMTYLDLSGLDFKAARLSGSDFYGADFTNANLAGTDLSRSRLDRAVLINAVLRSATLVNATILRPTIYRDMSNDLSDAPDFSGADMRQVRIQAELSGASFRGADLSRADFSPLELRPGQGTLVTLSRNVFKSCDFSGARFYRANLIRGDFTFARFNGADLRQADLTEADLSKADLRGADLTYANLTGADLYDTNLSGVKGLDTVKGLGTSKNLDKAIGVPSDIARQTK